MEEFLSGYGLVSNVRTRARSNSLLNPKMISRVLGVLLCIEALMFLICAGVSVIYRESDYIYFIYTAAINIGVGSLMMLYGKGAENRMNRRDGYCVVSLTWIFFTFFGMLPY